MKKKFKMIKGLLREYTFVRFYKYRKALELLRSVQNAIEKERDDKSLMERELHRLSSGVADKISKWKVDEHDESVNIGMKLDKKMLLAAMGEAPDEFKAYIAKQFAAQVVSGLEKLEDERKNHEKTQADTGLVIL
jgi:hypothetical protein